MKSISTLAILLISLLSASAQYFNPYSNPYANQQAFEWGRQMAEQMQAQQEESDAQSVNGCFHRIGSAIRQRDFSNAEEWAEKLLYLREDFGYYYLGLTNELQGYGNSAMSYYQKGVEAGSKVCQIELERIKTHGFVTDEQIDNVVNYFQQLEMLSYNMAAQITNNIMGDYSSSTSSSTSSSNSNRSSCSVCHGTGIDPTPTQIYGNYNWLAEYNPKGNKCKICNQYTEHYHMRCAHCNAPCY